jgi:hypothetical protein
MLSTWRSFSGDLSPGNQHAKDLVPEYGLQLFQFQRWGYEEHAFAVKAAVRDENMTVRFETENIAEGLDGDDCAGNGFFRERSPEGRPSEISLPDLSHQLFIRHDLEGLPPNFHIFGDRFLDDAFKFIHRHIRYFTFYGPCNLFLKCKSSDLLSNNLRKIIMSVKRNHFIR